MRHLLVLAALACSLLACADDSTSSSTATPAPSSSTTPTTEKPKLSDADRARAKEELTAHWVGTFFGTRTLAAGTTTPVSITIEIDKDRPTVRCGNVNSDLRCIDMATAVLPLVATVTYTDGDRPAEVLFGRATLEFALFGSSSETDGTRNGSYTSGTVMREAGSFAVDGVEWFATHEMVSGVEENRITSPNDSTFHFAFGRPTK